MTQLQLRIRELIRQICVRARHDDWPQLVDEFAPLFESVFDAQNMAKPEKRQDA